MGRCSQVIASISADAGTELQEAQQQHILKLLLGNAESEEECRHVVAECTGRLSLLNPQLVLPQLKVGAMHATSTSSASTGSTASSALPLPEMDLLRLLQMDVVRAVAVRF